MISKVYYGIAIICSFYGKERASSIYSWAVRSDLLILKYPNSYHEMMIQWFDFKEGGVGGKLSNNNSSSTCFFPGRGGGQQPMC